MLRSQDLLLPHPLILKLGFLFTITAMFGAQISYCLEYVCLSGFIPVLFEGCNLWDTCDGMQYICMYFRIHFQLLHISWLTRVIITSPTIIPAILRETVDTKTQLMLKRTSFM
jgi:hypothetical protein